MLLTKDKIILVVGLGVIGGSYAEGFTKAGYTVNAIDIDSDAVAYAKEKNMVSDAKIFADPLMLGTADLIVFALYPSAFVTWIKNNQSLIKKGALITDVTGVKTSIVYEVQSILREDLEYIPAHPMAGREASGIRYASANVFDHANMIITPTDKNTEKAIAIAREIAEILNFGKISILTPEEHDEMIGFLSQLTHCIAVSLMTCKNSEHLVDYTGDSFRDLTRIAKINENMWPELFRLNKKTLLNQMDLFLKEFSKLRVYIEEDETEKIKEMMRLSTKRRTLFDKDQK